MRVQKYFQTLLVSMGFFGLFVCWTLISDVRYLFIALKDIFDYKKLSEAV